MYDNREWLWQYQDKPVISTLYDGLFDIVSKVSPLGVLDILKLDTLSSGALGVTSRLFNIKNIGSGIVDAVIWDTTEWNTPDKYWNGARTSENDSFHRRYLAMRTAMFGKPFCIATIKQSLDILFENGYTCSVVEDEANYHFDINITTQDSDTASFMTSALQIDPIPFGKPSGYSYTITVTEE